MTNLLGVWRHYKGHVYEVLGVSKHSETLEETVVYQNVETGEIWNRPVAMWTETVEGKLRFERVSGFEEVAVYLRDADKPIPEDSAIAAAHPLETNNHALYAEAVRLVGAKHSKYALVDLVNWLLTFRERSKP